MTLDGLLDPSVTSFGYRMDGELLAVGALKPLDSSHAELKSMHHCPNRSAVSVFDRPPAANRIAFARTTSRSFKLAAYFGR